MTAATDQNADFLSDFSTQTIDIGEGQCAVYCEGRDSKKSEASFQYREGNVQDSGNRGCILGCVGESPIFPSVKPDIDVFGKPFSALISLLPPETIHRIVEMLARMPLTSMLGRRVHGRQIALGIMDLRLVCRHWESIFLSAPPQPWSFGLHGREDVMALRAFISSPGSYLKRNIESFNVITYKLDEDRCDPWLHLIPEARRLLPRYNAKSDMEQIDGPLGKGLKTIRSIHPYLPRTMPSSYFRRFRTLEIYDVFFQRFSDLQHLLCDLPDLSLFHGYDLSFPQDVLPEEPVLPSRRMRQSRAFSESWLQHLYLYHSICNVSVLTLSAASHPHHWAALYAICKAVVLPRDAKMQNAVRLLWKSFACEDRHSKCLDGNAVLYNITITPDNGTESQLRILLPTVSPSGLRSRHRSPDRLLLEFRHSPQQAEYIDWSALDKAATEDFSVQSITFGRDSGQLWSESGWKALADDEQQFITENLPLSSAAGLISFSTPPHEMIWNEDQTWPQEQC